jgi:hypothetical protein
VSLARSPGIFFHAPTLLIQRQEHRGQSSSCDSISIEGIYTFDTPPGARSSVRTERTGIDILGSVIKFNLEYGQDGSKVTAVDA